METPAVTAPDRSTLPDEYLDFLADQAERVGKRNGQKPILPAAETPEELVEAARTLERHLDEHLAQGAEAAKMLDFYMRKYINQALARQVTEKVEIYTHGLLETDLRDRSELSRAYIDFKSLMGGTDHSNPQMMAIIRKATIAQRKNKAVELGLELDLTDEEWWEL